MIPSFCYKPAAVLAPFTPPTPPLLLAKGLGVAPPPAPAIRVGRQLSPAEVKAAQAHWQKLMAPLPQHPLCVAPKTPETLMEALRFFGGKWQAMGHKPMVTKNKVVKLKEALNGMRQFEEAEIHPFHRPIFKFAKAILGVRTNPKRQALPPHMAEAEALVLFYRKLKPAMNQVANPEDPYALTSLARAWGLVKVIAPSPPKGDVRVPSKPNEKPPEEVFDAPKAFDLLDHAQRVECLARWQAWLPWENRPERRRQGQMHHAMAATLQAMLDAAPFYYPIDNRYTHTVGERPFPYWKRMETDLLYLLKPVQRHPKA